MYEVELATFKVRFKVRFKNGLLTWLLLELEKHFGSQLYSTVIPRNIKLAEAPSFGKSVLSYEPNAKGSLAYLSLAGELIGRMEDRYRGAANE